MAEIASAEVGACKVCGSPTLSQEQSLLVCGRCGAPHDEAGRVGPYPWRVPEALRTTIREVRLRCHQCKVTFAGLAADFINVAERPGLETELTLGRLNPHTCPSCGAEGNVAVPGFGWYDPIDHRYTVLVRDIKVDRPPERHVPVRPHIVGGPYSFALHDTVSDKKEWLVVNRFRNEEPIAYRVSQIRHMVADRGMVLTWLECHVLLTALEQDAWSFHAFERRLGTTLDSGPIGQAFARLIDGQILERTFPSERGEIRATDAFLKSLLAMTPIPPQHQARRLDAAARLRLRANPGPDPRAVKTGQWSQDDSAEVEP